MLITDQTYLFPTLISAIQARRHASPAIADVIIFHMGIDAGVERAFAEVCQAEGIGLSAIKADAVEGANTMMARMFMNRFVPAQYEQYLYLDGDVQITGSLDPLILADVPEARFLAANDPMTFMLAEPGKYGRALAEHMRGIGLDREQAGRYFNTGVLRINRRGWDAIGLAAWELTQRGAGGFRFPDQDPLNIVAADSHMPMSLAWNFPIFMMNARVERHIQPRIYHFMSKPKPWQGPFKPWRRAAFACYAEMLHRYPMLASYHQGLPPGTRLRYHLQQQYKRAMESVTWGHGARRARILLYEGALGYDLR